MAEDLRTAANWAKDLGVPNKKLKDALKTAGLEPDAKKGITKAPGTAKSLRQGEGLRPPTRAAAWKAWRSAPETLRKTFQDALTQRMLSTELG